MYLVSLQLDVAEIVRTGGPPPEVDSGGGDVTPPSPPEEEEEMPVQEAAPDIDVYQYWVVYTLKRRLGELHKWRGCWIQPEGVRDWDGGNSLENLVYDSMCKRCFRAAGPEGAAAGGSGEPEPSSPGTSSESSSSEEGP